MALRPKELCQGEECHPGSPCYSCVARLGSKKAHKLANKWQEDIKKEEPLVAARLAELLEFRKSGKKSLFTDTHIYTLGETIVWVIPLASASKGKKKES